MDLGLIKAFLDLNRPSEIQYLDNSKESRWIEKHYNTYGSLPLPATFEKEFNCELPSFSEDWEYYKKQLIDDDYVKKASPILEEFNDLSNKISAKESIVWLRDKLSSLSSKQDMGLGVSILNTMPSLVDHFKTSAGVRFPTGIEPYDNVSGGIGPDDILIVTARPGQGKSMVATALATNLVSEGLRVGFYSSEMSYQAVQARFASFSGGFSNYAITRGRDLTHWDDYVDSLGDWTGDFIVLTPKDLGGRFATPQDLKAFVVAAELDVLIIDQINGMSLGRGNKSTSEWSVLAELQMKLTEIQKSLGVPFIEVLQLNREASGETEPDLAKIAGADRFGQDASAVIGMWRKAKDVMVMKVLKSRDFDGNNLKWEFTTNFDRGQIIPRTDSVSAIKNAIKVSKIKADEDVLD